MSDVNCHRVNRVAAIPFGITELHCAMSLIAIAWFKLSLLMEVIQVERRISSSIIPLGIAQIPGFGSRKWHESFDFVFPNQFCPTIPNHSF